MTNKQNNNFNFEVPGQMSQASVYGETNNAADDSEGSYKRLLGDKPITWFWLMQHYSKENAAAYKKQKEKRKAEKEQRKVEKKQRKNENKTSFDLSEAEAEKKDLSKENHSDTYNQNFSETNRQEDNFGGTVYIDRSRWKTSPSVPRASLDCVGFGRTVDISGFPFRIGRSSEQVDLCIADNPVISSVHAEIIYEAGAFYIRDLKSLNHVFLNDMKIPQEQPVVLNNNVKITLGNEEFIFHNGLTTSDHF